MGDPLFCYLLKLARHQGIPPKQFLRTIDSEEVSWYLALERLHPLDDPWEINALNTYVTARAAGVKCKQTDFVPKWRPQQSGKQLVQALKHAAARGRKRKETNDGDKRTEGKGGH